MDSAILSIAPPPPPPTAVDITPGSSVELPMEPTTQRKITLLTRPSPAQTSLPSSSGVVSSPPSLSQPSSMSNALTSEVLDQSQSSAVASAMNQSFILPIQHHLVTSTRAARNDYYDTEDPSVNLQEFIANSMQAQKNRVILLKLEEMFFSYISDPTRVEPLKLPPWDSYHRMLAHRVAAYFGLEHNVDPMDKTCVIVCKGLNTRYPQQRFAMYLPPELEEVESTEPAKHIILKRSPRDTSTSSEKPFDPPLVASSTSEVKSFQEREEEYEKARARIFSQQPTPQSTHGSMSFDLGISRQGSSILPHIMHHRRTASDTATFKRPSSELKKEGPSSSHSSRSATPLFPSAFLRPIPPPQETSPQPQQQQRLSPQQQKHQQSEAPLPQSPPLQQSQPQQPSQIKYPRQRATTVPSFQFQPVQVVYPQAARMMPDPSWYYGGNMMLYPVGPQQYVPAPYATQMVQSPMFPVNQPYSITPGVIGQPSMVSPPASRPAMVPMRVPVIGPQGMMEPVTSPPHHTTGVTLVRPVPQQALPVRPQSKADATPWSIPQAPHMVPQNPATGPQQSGQTAFTTFVPVPQDPSQQQQLAERMEKLLTIGSSVGGGASIQQNDGEPQGSQQPEKQSQQVVQMAGMGQKHSFFMPSQGIASPPTHMPTTAVHTANGSGYGAYSMMPGMLAGEHLGGQMISPTQVRGPIQIMPHPHLIPGIQEPQVIGNHGQPLPHTPSGMLQYPSGMPVNQPSTPPVGPLNLHPPGILQAQQHQGFFPPTSTHSPVQILGHTLGTSLFSPPPPSTTTPHGVFINSPTNTGKVLGFAPGTPALPPVGSGPRFRRYESPKQGVSMPLHPQSSTNQLQQDSPTAQQKPFPKSASNGINPSLGSSSFQLPPRLAQQQQQQQQQRNIGTRYQNQRHPANRAHSVAKGGSDQVPFVPGPVGLSPIAAKKEPLLPTPPTAHMVKLDTTLTCGVPLNVMEVIAFPPEGTHERHLAFQALTEMGALDFKGGVVPRTGEDVMVTIFDSPESAIKALQFKHPHYTLSIPRNNHAKFILSLLQVSSA